MNSLRLRGLVGFGLAVAASLSAQTSSTGGNTPPATTIATPPGGAAFTPTTSLLPTNGGTLLGVSAFIAPVSGNGTASTAGAGNGAMPFGFTAFFYLPANLTSPAAPTTPTPANPSTTSGGSSGTTANLGTDPSVTPTSSTGPLSAPSGTQSFSVRASLSEDETTTVGFVVGGAAPRRVLIRALGPALSTVGVDEPLADPSFSVFRAEQEIAVNDNWGAAGVLSGISDEAGGASSAGATGGASSGTPTTPAGGTTSDLPLTGPSGLPVSTSSTATATGVSQPAVTPVATTLATADLFAQVGALALTAGSRDAASVVTLSPGTYTVQVKASDAAPSTTPGPTGTGPATTPTTASGTPATSSGSSAGATTTPAATAPGTTSTTSPAGTTTTSPTALTVATANSGEVLVEVYFLD